MTMTTRVLSVSVPVADEDAALRFYTEELVRMEGVPAMFSFTDPDGNGLVYLDDVTRANLGDLLEHTAHRHVGGPRS